MARRKRCKHDFYITDGKFKGNRLVETEETCDLCGKVEIVKVEPHYG